MIHLRYPRYAPGIYTYPIMNLNQFNDNYLNILLQKILFLFGDFNIGLPKYDNNAGINGFLDSISSYMFLLSISFAILHPTRVTGHSQTINDNIFTN